MRTPPPKGPNPLFFIFLAIGVLLILLFLRSNFSRIFPAEETAPAAASAPAVP